MGNVSTKKFNMIPLPFDELLLINRAWWKNRIFETAEHPYLRHIQDEQDLERIIALPKDNLDTLVAINTRIVVIDFQGNTNTVLTQKDRPILLFLAKIDDTEAIYKAIELRDDIDMIRASLLEVATASGAVTSLDLNTRKLKTPKRIERSNRFSSSLDQLISKDGFFLNGRGISSALIPISLQLNDVQLCVVYSSAWDKNPKKNEDTVIGKLIDAIFAALLI